MGAEWRGVSDSPEETAALGEVLGRRIDAGTVVALVGELGTGKTTFVRGLARGLGIPEGISSPSYTLMAAHEGRLPLFHFDAWMEGREKAWFLDGGDHWLASGEGVSAVEWAERVAEWLPEPRLEVELRHAPAQAGRDSGRREIRCRVVGEGGGERLGALLGELAGELAALRGERQPPLERHPESF